MTIAKDEKCQRCGHKFKEYCDGGCFVEYQFEHKELKFNVVLRALYDGSNKSRIELVMENVKVPQVKPYNMELFDHWVKDLESSGYELKSMISENYRYLECKCIKSIVGEPLGNPFELD